MTRILVTGHSGYVGSHVIAALKARGVEIIVICRDEAGAAEASAAGMRGEVLALEQVDRLAVLAADNDGIAHLAASEDPAFLTVNRAAISAMGSSMRKGAPFVMQGGSVVFGETGNAPSATIPAFNPPPPLAARAALDQEVLALASTGVRTHVVYGSFVFGGRGAMIPGTLLHAARAIGYSGYPAIGSRSWSAVHVADWADLIVRVLLDGSTSGVPVFAAAQTVTLREAAEAVAAAFDPPLPTRPVLAEQGYDLWGFFAPALALNQVFDQHRPRHDYGWAPPVRSIAAELKAAATALA